MMQSVQEICQGIITDECEQWLMNIGYYVKPASVKHHGVRSGDLYRHSFEVANQLQILTDKLDLQWEREISPWIVGLLHDVCKCDDYTLSPKTRKWTYNKAKMDGHGDKSVRMLVSHIEFTEEETYCIMYHMGAFVDKEEWGDYTKAVKKYPNVLYTHTADMIASQILGI